jgi:hypothetical protein
MGGRHTRARVTHYRESGAEIWRSKVRPESKKAVGAESPAPTPSHTPRAELAHSGDFGRIGFAVDVAI